MAKRKFEWKTGWTEVKERMMPPSSCNPGQYRRSALKGKKGVDAIYCCPRGTVFDERKRGCYRAGRKAGKPKLQALRHKLSSFKKRHPVIWKKLQEKKPGKGGLRVVTGS